MTLFLVALAAVGASGAVAATCTDSWTAKSGNWNTGGDWSTGKAPGSGDVACIEEKGTYTVTLEPSTTATVQVRGLVVGGAAGGTQTLKIVGNATNEGANLQASEEISIAAKGAVTLTSAGSHQAALGTSGSRPFANAGAINAELGGEGPRELYGAITNTGTVSIATKVAAQWGGTFTNAKGGVVAATGTGRLFNRSGRFVENGGRTTGEEPVVAEQGTSVEYAASGESHVFVRNSSATYLYGAPAAKQTLTVEGGCSSPYGYAHLYLEENVTNAGTITLTSGECEAEAWLEVPSSYKLTNEGTIAIAAGTGGIRRLGESGTIVNRGTIEAGAKSSSEIRGTLTNEGSFTLANEAVSTDEGTFKDSSNGSVATGKGSGHLRVSSGTYVQGDGETSGVEPVVAEQGGTLEYSGEGESHVIVRNSSTAYLYGALAAKQTLTVEGGCSSPYGYAHLYLEGDVTNAGSITLTSGVCAETARLEIPSSRSLTNTGTISLLTGAGGQRQLAGAGTLVNRGTLAVEAGATAADEVAIQNEASVSIAEETELLGYDTFTNSSGGVVAGGRSGMLLEHGKFVEGAGGTEGARPVVMEGGELEYTAPGSSRILVRGSTTYLYGNIAKGQELIVDGSCESSYHDGVLETTEEHQVNEGTIVLTSDCEAPAYLEQDRGGLTLTNKGTIKADAGAGGEEYLYTGVDNEGTLEVAEKAKLLGYDTFVNGSGGVVAGGKSGLLLEQYKFVEDAGRTEGSRPVVMEDGQLEYTGPGSSRILVRGSTTDLYGNIAKGQELVVDGSCESSSHEGLLETTEEHQVNEGTIVLTSDCEAPAYLTQDRGGLTLTNKGTIKAEAGAGGERYLYTGVDNEGTLEVAEKAKLFGDDTFVNGSGGVVAGGKSGLLLEQYKFVEDAGRTEGSRPVVMEGGQLEYTGPGSSRILVRGATTYLYGNIAKGQELVVDGSCESSAHEGVLETTEEHQVNEGTIVLTSDCEAPAYLTQDRGGLTLTNKGTIKAEAGAGGERYLYAGVDNEGTLEVAEKVKLLGYDTFVNGSGGVVAGGKSGLLLEQDKFVEGAGGTEGARPVVMEGGELEYTAPGSSRILVRGSTTYLYGNIAKGQELIVDGSCEASYHEGVVAITEEHQVNEGTIVLTSDCEAPAYLEQDGSRTLTNKGSIKAEAGAGGERYLYADVDNEGALSIDAGVLLRADASFTQGKSGTLRPAIASTASFGALSVSGTATLAGAIEPAPQAGFKAVAGDRFAILTATTRSGVFQFEKNGSIGGALWYKPTYPSGGMTLEATETPPEGLPEVTSPPHVFGTARRGHTLVLTHGSWTHEPFEYFDHWLRCNGSGGACEAIPGASGTSYELTKEDVGHTIRAQETASDSGGESLPAQSAPTATIAELELHADAGGSIVATVGQQATLDGSGSTPAGEIESYRWDFGDGHGETTTGAIAHHVYSEPTNGTPLKATVTVTHGSEEATSAPVDVTVLPAPGPSEALAVTVEDESGHQLEGAEVVYIAPDGAKTEARTEHGPALLAGLPDGKDTLYAYASGYRPTSFQATVEEHHGTATVKLASGAPVETKLKSRELTLEEIEAHGIDPSDPANRNVYDFELRLAFTHGYEVQPVELHAYVNAEGEFVGSGGGGAGGHLEGEPGGAGGWSCQPTQCEYTPPKEGAPTDWHIVAQPIVVEGHPLIQWLIIKGKASVLKQFFEVSMIIQNLSEPRFGLTAGQATLHLPPGLTLAPTAEPQQAEEHVAAIPGEGTAEADWIVRGDEEGEYWPSATYESHLEPFDAPISSQAALATPMRVWGKDALELEVEGDEEGLVEGVPWHFKLGVRDKADIPLYNVELQVEEEPHANFDWQPRQQWAEMLGELKPGESAFVKQDYIVVPDADSEEGFQPQESSATFAGEKIEKGRGITKVPRQLPVEKLTAPEDTPGYVHLEWQPVPEAERYEVYSTPSLTTSFANTPDHVATSPGGATETTLPGTARNAYATAPPGEYRWYAVTAVIKGQRRLELNTVHAKADEGEPEGPPGPPEIGRCAATKAGEGKYSSSKCTANGGKDAYEWLPGVDKPGLSTKLASGTVTLESEGRFKVTCTGESGTGSFHGAKRLEGVTLRLTGCEHSSQPCTSSDASAGEVVTGALNGLLGVSQLGTPDTKDKLALSLFPPGHKGTITSFSCGSTSVVLAGAVLVPVPADKTSEASALKFKASKGVQKPEQFVGGLEEVLEESTDGGSHYEQAGLTASLTLQTGESIEFDNAF